MVGCNFKLSFRELLKKKKKKHNKKGERVRKIVKHPYVCVFDYVHICDKIVFSVFYPVYDLKRLLR